MDEKQPMQKTEGSFTFPTLSDDWMQVARAIAGMTIQFSSAPELGDIQPEEITEDHIAKEAARIASLESPTERTSEVADLLRSLAGLSSNAAVVARYALEASPALDKSAALLKSLEGGQLTQFRKIGTDQ